METHIVALSIILIGSCALAGNTANANSETAKSSPVIIYDKVLKVPQVPRADFEAATHSRLVNIGDINLYIQDVGQGPTLVLLNGGPGNTLHAFHPEFMRAAKFARVLFYDRRGQGRSDWQSNSEYTVAQAVEDLEKLREAMDVQRWILVGHSWGGFLALAYAKEYPDHSRGIVLIDALTQMDAPDASDNQHVFEFMSQEEQQRTREIYTAGGRIVASHSDMLDLASLQERVFNAYMNGDWRRQHYYKPSIQQIAQVALYDWIHDKNYNSEMARDTQNYDLTGAFIDSPIPVLAMEGRWSPVWGTWTSNRLTAIREAFGNSNVIVFEKSAHNPFKAEPQKFFTELQHFVEGLQLD